MNHRYTSIVLAGVALSFACVGCTQADEDAPEFIAGQGEEAAATAYPAGPYGFDPGTIAPDLQFLGYPNFVERPGELRIVKLSDFYNPTGAEVFDEAHGYFGAGQPKPRAMVMLISSVWCGPCNSEAANVLPGEYDKWQPMGGHFLAILIDGPEGGVPATIADMFNWSTSYQPRYTESIDPSNHVMSWYEPAFPGNMIIRTSDMKIIMTVAGVPSQGFWSTFETVLKGTYVDPLDPIE